MWFRKKPSGRENLARLIDAAVELSRRGNWDAPTTFQWLRKELGEAAIVGGKRDPIFDPAIETLGRGMKIFIEPEACRAMLTRIANNTRLS